MCPSVRNRSRRARKSSIEAAGPVALDERQPPSRMSPRRHLLIIRVLPRSGAFGLTDLSDPHVTVASREADAAAAIPDLSFDVSRAPPAGHLDWEVRFEILGRYVRLHVR